MKQKIDVSEKIVDEAGSFVANYYDKQLIEATTQPLCYRPRLKIIGYRKVKVPVYFEINIPVIERWTDYDSEYSFGDLKGWVVHFKKFNLFKIGTKIEEEPIYEKPKKSNKTIKFRRYGDVK